LIHLKMTGQLIYIEPSAKTDTKLSGNTKLGATIRVGGGHPSADWVQNLPSKHTRVTINFTDGATLFFNDQRVFGWLKLLTTPQLHQEFAKLAPDINDPTLDHQYFYDKIKNRKLKIKQLIMDNSIVAGVGNIYACDALNLARISPEKSAHLLSKADCQKLFNAMQTVIDLGIKLGGATISDFAHVDGFAGQYQTQTKVYNRLGQNCYNCNTPIEKKKVAGRGTYFCPSCQV
jgi:formamidopyrimidine-DNA glycosylase